MNTIISRHGGHHRGQLIMHDLSTNANQLGPCPFVLNRVHTADYSSYPDPEYQSLRTAIADRHGVSAGQVVVGAGASELILRLVRRHSGPVRVLGPSFSEYERCARIEGRPCFETSDPATFAAIQRLDDGLGFACWPNNPTGETWPIALLAEASRRGRIVVDLAYAPLCAGNRPAQIEKAVPDAFRLYSPNKSFGLTGIRAAYMIMPEPDERLQWMGASWSVDAAGVRFLEAVLAPEADAWLAATLPELHARRTRFADQLRAHGFPVMESCANFLLAQLGDPKVVTRSLQALGIGVRDATSFGLRGWFRLAAPEEQVATELLAALLDAKPETLAYNAAR